MALKKFENLINVLSFYLKDKIGHHKIGACAKIGQNRIRGGWGVKKSQKKSDIIYVRSLIVTTQNSMSSGL